VHITAQPPPHLQNDLYCVEWDVKLYYTQILADPTVLLTELVHQSVHRATLGRSCSNRLIAHACRLRYRQIF